MHVNYRGRRRKVEEDAIFVKVSMDGAPYLRKLDLTVYRGYEELIMSLSEMFRCYSLGNPYECYIFYIVIIY